MAAERCSPSCKFFRCGQKVMEIRGNEVYCRFAEDACEGPDCKYAVCIRNRMLANGSCGLSLKRTKETPDIPRDIPPEEAVQGFKVKGKLHQRFREEEFY